MILMTLCTDPHLSAAAADEDDEEHGFSSALQKLKSEVESTAN